MAHYAVFLYEVLVYRYGKYHSNLLSFGNTILNEFFFQGKHAKLMQSKDDCIETYIETAVITNDSEKNENDTFNRIKLPAKIQSEEGDSKVVNEFSSIPCDVLPTPVKELAQSKCVKATKRVFTPTAERISSKKAKTEKRPRNQRRYDLIGHLPEVDKNSSGTRCKNEECHFKTHVFCSKCMVHLCLVHNRNCFKGFHVLETQATDAN